MKPILIYCFDAYCGWCFGFSSVIKRIWINYKETFDFEVLSAGMILPQQPISISVTASYILKSYKTIETITGAAFGDDYLWHIKNALESDWYPDSEKPAIALQIFKEYFPEKQVAFATDLQYALYVEGRDLCDDEAYRHLLMQYGITENYFYTKLHNEAYKEKAYEEFALVKQLKIAGYPCVLLQISTSKFYLISNGYTDYATLSQRIVSIINQLNFQN